MNYCIVEVYDDRIKDKPNIENTIKVFYIGKYIDKYSKVINKDKIYKVNENISTEDFNDIYKAEKLATGDIYYITSFNNNGRCFNEALYECMQKIDDKEIFK